ncbi:hypothetical protein [Gordonia sp. (in: high G+C Gram-positive bacteria)]|uniref:hypothetical protein n=1 Tax=Gordonia sp. (in: high G+C Gram-positive bacteria) TaxID=84139 RepID=UPI0039E27191
MRFGRVEMIGPGAADSGVLERALTASGFVVGGSATVGLWCFDVSGEPSAEAVVALRALRKRCDAVALVGTGIENCPSWPERVSRWSTVVDPDGGLALFAVASGLHDDDPDASGLPELSAWVEESADAAASVELAGRDTVERLTGLRVGSAAVRTWAGGAIHSGFRELAAAGAREAAALRSGDVATFTRWFRHSTAGFEEAVVGAAAGQAAHLQSTATIGLRRYDRNGDPVPSASAPVPPVPWRDRGWGAEDAVIVLIGASSGLGVGRLAAGSMAAWFPGAAALIVAALLGVAVAAGAVALRRRVLLRNQARAWVVETVADARARTEWRVAAMLGGVEPAVAARVRRATG